MKKKNKSINNNFFLNLNQNQTYNNNHILNSNSTNKVKYMSDNISNQLKKKFKKNIKQKKKIISSKLNNSQLNSISSCSIPYHYILDELMKYLETKVKPSLYEDVNNYVNKKINTYYLESIENLNKYRSQKIKNDFNNKYKKRNTMKEIKFIKYLKKKKKIILNFILLK